MIVFMACKFFIFFCFVFHRELLLNNNQLRVLPFELGKLFQLQTLGLKGTTSFYNP